jgi:hypothetical protein
MNPKIEQAIPMGLFLCIAFRLRTDDHYEAVKNVKKSWMLLTIQLLSKKNYGISNVAVIVSRESKNIISYVPAQNPLRKPPFGMPTTGLEIPPGPVTLNVIG